MVALSEVQGLVRTPLRKGGTFEAHEAHDHGIDDGQGRHEDEEHEDEEHESEEHAAAHGDEDHDAHRRGAFDMHIWLDPVNAGVMARAIASVLSEADPANAGTYSANAQALRPRLEELTAQIAAEMAPVRDKPFIVFHDAYRYFEDRFGLTAAGSMVVSPDRSPGVRRISELRDKIRELGVACVFAEPQFEPRLIDVIIEGTPARTGTVDPLGATIESGPELYFTLIHNMAVSFKSCLTPVGQG